MKKLLETVGGLLLLFGAVGVLRELTGWSISFLGATRLLTENVAFLHDHAALTNAAIAVVGFVTVMIAESRSR
ncbi:hypothetical protein ACH4E8_29745 [Streptomyces sp. NPDC017979]|uniref:hypothetical protein n=1 Tax=Streptomyces sp. NPDC017979 TaxID=3365024 RepID=UPI00379B7EA7